MIHCAFF